MEARAIADGFCDTVKISIKSRLVTVEGPRGKQKLTILTLEPGTASDNVAVPFWRETVT